MALELALERAGARHGVDQVHLDGCGRVVDLVEAQERVEVEAGAAVLVLERVRRAQVGVDDGPGVEERRRRDQRVDRPRLGLDVDQARAAADRLVGLIL